MIPSAWLGILLILTSSSTPTHSSNVTDPILSPPVDLSQLGRVGFTGNFDALSQYQYQGQLESGLPATNSSDSIRTQLPNGDFITIVSSDAAIDAICAFVLESGTLAGLVAAGNFTELGGMDSPGVGLFNANTSAITPFPGLSGEILTVFCDDSTNSIYIGGSFKGANSTNALMWVGGSGWTNLPFQGFNAPVASIAKLSSGHFLFGGEFSSVQSASGSSNISLNGLFEYDPSIPWYGEYDASAIVRFGNTLAPNAAVNQVLCSDEDVYVGGDFTGLGVNNIFLLRGNETDKLSGGVNAPVETMLLVDDILFVGGTFTSTNETMPSSANFIASYSTQNGTWHALGAGVNGPVNKLNTLLVNITAGKPETVIIVNGDFTQLREFGSNKAVETDGLGVWVPSVQNWLDNLEATHPVFVGKLRATASTSQTNTTSNFFTGTIVSYGQSANAVIMLQENGVDGLNIKMANSNTTNSINIGVFYFQVGRNVTVLGGQFALQGSNDTVLYNLAFLNGSNGDSISGPFSFFNNDEIIHALAVEDDILYVGGKLSRTVQNKSVEGFFLYDLYSDDFTPIQPAALMGDNVTVAAVESRPSQDTGNNEVYVGGTFDAAGTLDCPCVCVYDTQKSAWKRPGTGLTGSTSFMTWIDEDTLIMAGNFSVSKTPSPLVAYYAPDEIWTPFNVDKPLNGTITAMSQTITQGGALSWSSDSNTFWVAGKSQNGSTFLAKWDGTDWLSAGDSFGTNSEISVLKLLSLTKNREGNIYFPFSTNLVLLIGGKLDMPAIGQASAVYFDGETFTPFLLTKTASGETGKLTSFMAQVENFYVIDHSIDGTVVLIASIVLSTLVLVILIGEIGEKVRRYIEQKRRGYTLARSS